MFALSYLNDLIILSEASEEHLETVFKKLEEFKLHANRDKCAFLCDCVKYLGHYIRNFRLEVDSE